jgi:hypothetical protein
MCPGASGSGHHHKDAFVTYNNRRKLSSDMNRKQRRAAAKGANEFLIGVQISKQVREFFGEERAGQLGSDLLRTVLKTMKSDATPERSVLFQLTPKIDGSEICFAVELDWRIKTAALAFWHELPADGSIEPLESLGEVRVEHTPRLSGESLERARELYETSK